MPRARAGRFLSAFFGAVVLFVVACSQKQEPVEVVRSFMMAVERFDLAEAESLVCEEQRIDVRESLESYDDVAGLSEAFDMVWEDLSFQERSNDGVLAVVHVTGTLRLSFLGQEDVQEVNEEHVVVMKDGRWVMCDP